MLKPRDDEDPNTVQVIIETPKSSRDKYAFDPKQKVFELKKVLLAGMTFPYDFGFIPSTQALNDRIVAIELEKHSYCLRQTRRRLRQEISAGIEEFFVTLHQLIGKGTESSTCEGLTKRAGG